MTREEAKKQIEAFRTCMIVDNAESYVVEALNMAIEALEQEPFMNKLCVAHQVCHEDKVKVLDKIREEIVEDIERYNDIYDDTCHGLRMALDILDKYKAESEEQA